MDQREERSTQVPEHFDVQSRSALALSTDSARRTVDDVWRCAQRGLVYPSPYAVFAGFFRNPTSPEPITRRALGDLMRDVREKIHRDFTKAHTTAVVGVGFSLWRDMSERDGLPLPDGMRLSFPDSASGDPQPGMRSTLFDRPASTFADSQADLWFHIKSDQQDHCDGVFDYIRDRLTEAQWMDGAQTVHQQAATKSNAPDKRGGKVVGSRFSENLNNATDPLTVQQSAVIGFEDLAHIGGSFVVAQRFHIDWDAILGMHPHSIEDMVGRTTHDTLIPSRDEGAHIKRSRAQDEAGNTTPVLRLGLPFGQSDAINHPEQLDKGASRRDEKGIYFAGYARSVRVLERIIDRQIGHDGFMADRLLAHMRSDFGGFFYIPSALDLDMPVGARLADGISLKRFPGVDWSRLDRHFDQTSANGLLHYNHKEYLYRMTTMTSDERRQFDPPSHRILSLLSNSFSRWQDNWYIDRKQPEFLHLREYLAASHGDTFAEEVMAQPVAVRSGWAARVLLGQVLVDESIGFRGQRVVDGKTVNGTDTYRIQPSEILVGAMPNLGLGEGKYLIDFARDDEQLDNFFDNLSYASGVGHVVPTFARALQLGLSGLIADIQSRQQAATTEDKKHFYAGAVLALEGVVLHCEAYADLADQMAARLSAGQSAERDNLAQISGRMRRLASGVPASLADATQLVFTLHACLHHAGEPTAVGRLDQLLQPFYESDFASGVIDEAQAQEIIDSFWVKLGEKVLLNRQFVDDHQVFGNLAMGGASAPYPQGSSNNQWIQQVTVGGTVADNAPGTGSPAYNDVTRLCLRAARRLPLNAPCLSLRVRSDMPADIIHEASLAILSGGAHPILVSDEKTIPALAKSGDRIGNGSDGSGSTPVAEKAGGLFQSEVSLADARDYACDGCYEPQLSGNSWFTLGGLVSLQPLECALNQGKTWQSAGPVWFRGQRVSFTSKPAVEIETFDELIELYFKHMRWLYAKQANGQLQLFGRMQAVCPAPLLSVFINGCLDKGLDYYQGGPRYNVIAPCFTGLSTLVDSLWAIRHLVFDASTAMTSLPELVTALRCNWGEHMVEPFISVLEGPARIEAKAERYRRIRAAAMALPKFGRGHAGIDQFGDAIVGRVAQTAVDVFTRPAERTAARMLALAKQLGTAEQPFGGFQIQPGVGTFENYLDWGNMTGASADGRLSGDSIASDLSPAPSYGDQPVQPRPQTLQAAMEGYDGQGVAAMWDGTPVDFNIPEDFPVEDLEKAIAAFANGRGSSIVTITCADVATMEAATKDPEKYDLLRVRMGGWSEFFVAMFPAHQAQHQRRPRSIAAGDV